MDAKQQKLEQEKTQRQLEQAAGKVQMLGARAKERKAEGTIAEVTGLQALHDRIHGQFKAWKEADEASVEELREEVQQGAEALDRATDAAADRLDRLDDASDDWLDAEADQVGGAYTAFIAWLGEEWVEDKQAALGASKDLRASWEDVGKRRQALKAAAQPKKDEARRALQESLGKLKRKLQEAANHFKPAGKGTEQRT